MNDQKTRQNRTFKRYGYRCSLVIQGTFGAEVSYVNQRRCRATFAAFDWTDPDVDGVTACSGCLHRHRPAPDSSQSTPPASRPVSNPMLASKPKLASPASLFRKESKSKLSRTSGPSRLPKSRFMLENYRIVSESVARGFMMLHLHRCHLGFRMGQLRRKGQAATETRDFEIAIAEMAGSVVGQADQPWVGKAGWTLA